MELLQMVHLRMYLQAGELGFVRLDLFAKREMAGQIAVAGKPDFLG